MKPQQTADLIALILAGVVAVVVLATAATLLYLQIVDPEQDLGEVASFIGDIVGVLIAALVGYMAGRQIHNGEKHEGG